MIGRAHHGPKPVIPHAHGSEKRGLAPALLHGLIDDLTALNVNHDTIGAEA